MRLGSTLQWSGAMVDVASRSDEMLMVPMKLNASFKTYGAGVSVRIEAHG